MSETSTPGQVAYEAYRNWYVTADPASDDVWPEHAELVPDDRAAWDAAAQAVLEHATGCAAAEAAVQAVVQAAQARLAQEEEKS